MRTEAELMGVKNFGATSLNEIRQKLGDFNLDLRTLDEDELPDDLDHNLLSQINATRDMLCAEPARLLQEFDSSSRALLAEI